VKTVTYSMPRIRELCLLVFFSLALTFSAISMVNASENLPGVKLTRTNAEYICMINNERFKKLQTPVIVDGKTYYGCCKMCETTLKKDPKSRLAIDPVSGKQVDKSAAVIGVASDGRAFYFENEANMNSYTPPAKK